jgi:hypothetical protein
MTTIEKHLNKFGEPGSLSRLQEIAKLNLGKRSEAAKRVIAKRTARMKAS